MPLYEGFKRLTELTYYLRRLDGNWSEPVTREIFERGLAGAVLPYDPVLDRVVLVRQFRPGALLANASGWEMEPIAGICEDGESTQATVEREAMETRNPSIQAVAILRSMKRRKFASWTSTSLKSISTAANSLMP